MNDQETTKIYQDIVFKTIGWLVVFSVPPTERSFTLPCEGREDWLYSMGIQPKVVAWQSTQQLRHASSTL